MDVKKEVVKSPVMNTHGAQSPNVGANVSSMDTSARTLAEKNRKGEKFKSLASKFYPQMDPKADPNA